MNGFDWLKWYFDWLEIVFQPIKTNSNVDLSSDIDLFIFSNRLRLPWSKNYKYIKNHHELKVMNGFDWLKWHFDWLEIVFQPIKTNNNVDLLSDIDLFIFSNRLRLPWSKNYKYIKNHHELTVMNGFDWLKWYFDWLKIAFQPIKIEGYVDPS